MAGGAPRKHPEIYKFLLLDIERHPYSETFFNIANKRPEIYGPEGSSLRQVSRNIHFRLTKFRRSNPEDYFTEYSQAFSGESVSHTPTSNAEDDAEDDHKDEDEISSPVSDVLFQPRFRQWGKTTSPAQSSFQEQKKKSTLFSPPPPPEVLKSPMSSFFRSPTRESRTLASAAKKRKQAELLMGASGATEAYGDFQFATVEEATDFGKKENHSYV
jgi:hypothetical protein